MQKGRKENAAVVFFVAVMALSVAGIFLATETDMLPVKNSDCVELASWKYGEDAADAEINALLSAKDTGGSIYLANDGVNAESSFLSARKYSTDERNRNIDLSGSSGGVSFGTEPHLQAGDYYQFLLSTQDREDICITFDMYTGPGGPGDFKIQYSRTGKESDYHDTGLVVTEKHSGTSSYAFMLPVSCGNQDALYLRLIITGPAPFSGGRIAATGTWGIGNIVFTSGMNGVFLGEYLSVKVTAPQNLLNRGDAADVHVAISNTSQFDIDGVNVNMNAPYFAAQVSGSLDTVIRIGAGKTITLDYSYIILEGGREAFTAILEKNGGKVSGHSGISVYGPGYFRGDDHSHTIYSDGIGTVADNVNEAFSNKMLSWLYSTDHNAFAQKADTVTQTARMNGMFVNLAGTEFTASNGHALTLGIDDKITSDVSANVLSGGTYGNLEKWQAIVDSVTGPERNGAFYMAHPYSASLGFDNQLGVISDDTIRDLRKYTGFEIWNGPYDDPGNIRAREGWDKVNTQGTGHYSGLTGSDAHTPSDVGTEYIKAFLPELTADNINDILKTGSYYGSNGPEVRFDIDGVGISGTLNITGSRTADFNIHAYSPIYNLTKVEIIKNTVTGRYESNRAAVYSCDLTAENTDTYDRTIRLEVRPGEFYRVEVQSGHAITDASSLGYAITNNIWIEKADRSNATGITNVQYTGSGIELLTLPTGVAYLKTSGYAVFDIDEFNATVASGATLEKTYDSGKNVVILTVIAEDGTTADKEFFVLSAAADHENKPSGGTDSTTLYLAVIALAAVVVAAMAALISVRKARGT